MTTLDLFSHSLSRNVFPCEGGTIIPMQGYSRAEDFYLCVPVKGIYFRSANNHRYGLFMYELFIDGEFVGGTKMYKKNNITRLYNEGLIDEAKKYALGYMLWQETSLGGRRINKIKEAARISHNMCDMSGKVGHDIRQTIRKKILYGKF